MKNCFLEKQSDSARNSYNYFFMKMVTKILIYLILLAVFLLINQIFDILVINIITLLLSIYYVFNIYKVIDNYSYILNDIRNTFTKIDFSLVLDINTVKDNIYKVVKYGK